MKCPRDTVDLHDEFELMKNLRHPNIILLEEVLTCQGREVGVMEYMSSGDLSMVREVNIHYVMIQLLSGLAYLHENGIAHRDLKPHNILLNGPMVKICDFGLACRFAGPIPHDKPVVTLWYRAPELLLGTYLYTEVIDVWSAGCIFAGLLNNKAIFRGLESKDVFFEADQCNAVFRVMGRPMSLRYLRYYKNLPLSLPLVSRLNEIVMCSEEEYYILSSMLQMDPAKRITASVALKLFLDL